METVFSLGSLRPRLIAAGLPGEALELWFAHILRDGFALDATGVYRPFLAVACDTLTALMGERGFRFVPERVSAVIDGFAELKPHPDAGIAFRRLHEAGLRIITLTNGSAEATVQLLRRNGLEPFIEEIVSVHEIRHWKPHREVYLHAAHRAGIAPEKLALVAAHAWDIHGAGCAGLKTVYVARSKRYPKIMRAPDCSVQSLAAAAEALAGTTGPWASQHAKVDP
ncbi:MAG: haloacid dehalogenase type II [Proteobacteria bacterium]|nr:haloacid dehalogenase type II [Pseudomonadota bacterium]